MKTNSQRMKKSDDQNSEHTDAELMKEIKTERHHSSKFWKILLTMGGAGYAPIAPGTAGALVALLIGILIINFLPFPNILIISLIVSFTFLGIKGSDLMAEEWGKDPKKIVIDEAVGMWISMLFITNSWMIYLLAFALFRFFDIMKPLGIRSAEKIGGGAGVMADDILAGIYSMILVQTILLILMITA